MRWLIVLGCACCIGVLAVAVAQEERIPLDKVPKAVLDAAKARFPNAEVLAAEKEVEDGKTIYELGIKSKGQSIDVSLLESGTILEIEKQVAIADLPKAVSGALQKRFPKAKYGVVEEVVLVKNGEETLEYFEAHLESPEGKEIEVRVAPSGKFLPDEKSEQKDR